MGLVEHRHVYEAAPQRKLDSANPEDSAEGRDGGYRGNPTFGGIRDERPPSRAAARAA